ncbi:Nuclear actin-protein involved in chromatin remodeling [Pleurotus pulmonarius]|nr:Nuclear actin-protein involved in chromatin remodeling [Pleurotus pulmonarius]KAF4607145.1 Nuclear actin-protein involved in chromatin remodeling [Pleurotus pulmonarius]
MMEIDDPATLAAANSPQKIIRLPTPVPPSVSFPSSYDYQRDQQTPLIIDNGSTYLRYGFATSHTPRTGLNVVAKYKERKSNKPLLLFGEGIDAESGARSQAKMPWEGDVLLNFDALENCLDYAFIQLGIDTPTVDHPVLMTERLCSPLHSRVLTSELMFEQYSVPSLTYCVDAVMSFYHNKLPSTTSSGLTISFNTASTSVIPILDGKGIMSHAKRIPWGASQASEYLLKLIQLKYPNFPTRVTTLQSNWMLQNFCEFATDYTALLRKLKDPLNMRSAGQIIQFPFVQPVTEEKTEEELVRIAEKRKELGRKLQEMAATKRMEKLVQKESDLQYLTNLKDSRTERNKREWMNKLQGEGFEDEASLDETIKKLETDLKKARKKEVDGDDPAEEPSFPLVDVPDAELDEEQIKEKKKQKLLKAGFEARARARKEKEREREEKEREGRMDEEERLNDPSAWARQKRHEHETLMTRIKDRARRRAALSDRKSAAAQARMKSIANLAADDRVPKKKRKAGGEDMFGADDADWAIYRKINAAAASSDEEEDMNQLHAVEAKLLEHDPTFTNEHTHASLASQRSALLLAFRPVYEEGDIEGNTRIHLNTERWRVCEAWFSPGMAGVDSAGLGEVVQNVLAPFSEAEKARLVNNVFITGNPSRLPGLVPRLHATLRPIMAPEMTINIKQAGDPGLDAWRGMADFGKTDDFKNSNFVVTREEYEEWGGERVKKWWGGNWSSSFVP